MSRLIQPKDGRTRGLISTALGRTKRRILWHNGQTPESGYQAFASFIPELSATVVVLANVDDSAVDLTATVLDAVEDLPPTRLPKWTFARVLNTFHALRLGPILALLTLFSLWWCFKHPRKDRAEDLSYLGAGLMVVASTLVETQNWLFAAGCVSASVLSVLIVRRPAIHPWRWTNRNSLGAIFTLAAAVSVIAGVLMLRGMS